MVSPVPIGIVLITVYCNRTDTQLWSLIIKIIQNDIVDVFQIYLLLYFCQVKSKM